MARNIADFVSALKSDSPRSNMASMLHKPRDLGQAWQREHKEAWHGHAACSDRKLPASCSLLMLQSRSAMTRCMATEKAISALPLCGNIHHAGLAHTKLLRKQRGVLPACNLL